MKTTEVQYVPLLEVLKKLKGGVAINHLDYDKWAAKFGLTPNKVLIGNSRYMKFVTLDEAEAAYAKFLLKGETAEDPTLPSAETELHLGALETKVDRLNERVKQLEDAINIQIKALNWLNDEVRKLVAAFK